MLERAPTGWFRLPVKRSWGVVLRARLDPDWTSDLRRSVDGVGGHGILRLFRSQRGWVLVSRSVGFASVEQAADTVVAEVGESEGDSFDPLDQFVDCYLEFEGWSPVGPGL